MKLQLEGVRMADIASNTPMRLSLGFEGDGEGKSTRDFFISDPTVIQPGGWVYKLLDQNMGMSSNAYDEIIRQQYESVGYENVPVGNYISDMAIKDLIYAGGGTEEDLARLEIEKQDHVIKSILLNPEAELPQYTNNEGTRGVYGETGFVPFSLIDRGGGQSFNEAAWMVLQNQPDKLSALRQRILDMSMSEFSGLNF